MFKSRFIIDHLRHRLLCPGLELTITFDIIEWSWLHI